MAERHLMGRQRLEAFSDAVIAIIMTIMVLELKVPHGADLASLKPLFPVFTSYLVSFVFLGIYWNNHHHLLHAVQRVTGSTLWANLHLLFWLSLVPFGTAWMGDSHFARSSIVLYGVIQIGAGVAYWILVQRLLVSHPPDSAIARAIGNDFKGRISVVGYAGGIALSFIHPLAGLLLYVLVDIWWLIPDRRIERALNETH